jgi:hypothetical protein
MSIPFFGDWQSQLENYYKCEEENDEESYSANGLEAVSISRIACYEWNVEGWIIR